MTSLSCAVAGALYRCRGLCQPGRRLHRASPPGGTDPVPRSLDGSPGCRMASATAVQAAACGADGADDGREPGTGCLLVSAPAQPPEELGASNLLDQPCAVAAGGTASPGFRVDGEGPAAHDSVQHRTGSLGSGPECTVLAGSRAACHPVEPASSPAEPLRAVHPPANCGVPPELLLPPSLPSAATSSSPEARSPLPYTRCWPALDALVAPPQPPGSYQPFLRHYVTHVKLHGADPSMIAPGYEARLAELVATRTGRRLSRAYVRPGCIELVLDCEDWGSGLVPRLPAQPPSPGAWGSRSSSGDWEERGSGRAGGLARAASERGAGTAGAGGRASVPRSRRSADGVLLWAGVGLASAGGGAWRSSGARAASFSALQRASSGPSSWLQVSGPGGGALANAGLQAWEVAEALQLALPTASPAERGGPTQPPSPDPPLRLLLDSGPQFHTAGAGSSEGRRRMLGGESDIQVLMALAAGRPDTPSSANTASEGTLRVDGQASTRPLPLTLPLPEPRSECTAPRLLSLEPRVLLLPPQEPPAEGAGRRTPPAPSPLAFEASVRGGVSDEPLELLVRAEGRYLAALVTTSAHAHAPAPVPTTPPPPPRGADAGGVCDVGPRLRCRVELPASPRWPLRPGIVLCDLRCGGVPVAAAPVLALRRADVAAELGSALAAGQLPDEDRDSLLMDLGTWLFHAGEGEGGQARTGEGEAARAPGGAPGPAAEVAERLPLLGMHLLRYARQSGWAATAACLEEGLAGLGVTPQGRRTDRSAQQQPVSGEAPGPAPALAPLQQRAGGAAAGPRPQAAQAARSGLGAAGRREAKVAGVQGGSAPVGLRQSGAAAALARSCITASVPRFLARRRPRTAAAACPAAPASFGFPSTSAASPQPAGGGAHAARGGGGGGGAASSGRAGRPARAGRLACVWCAVLQVLGLARPPAEEEADYRAYVETRLASNWHISAFIDLLAVGIGLVNMLRDPCGGWQVGMLLAGWVGPAQLLLRLTLPRRLWPGAKKATRVLRYLVYLGIKVSVGVGLVPRPRGIERYILGPGALVQEGLVLAAAEMVPPLALLVISPLRTLVNTILVLGVAPSAGLAGAAARAAAVSCLEAATTLAAHVCLRLSYGARAAARRRCKAGAE